LINIVPTFGLAPSHIEWPKLRQPDTWRKNSSNDQ